MTSSFSFNGVVEHLIDATHLSYSRRDKVADSDLNDEQPIILSIKMSLGDLRLLEKNAYLEQKEQIKKKGEKE